VPVEIQVYLRWTILEWMVRSQGQSWLKTWCQQWDTGHSF